MAFGTPTKSRYGENLLAVPVTGGEARGVVLLGGDGLPIDVTVGLPVGAPDIDVVEAASVGASYAELVENTGSANKAVAVTNTTTADVIIGYGPDAMTVTDLMRLPARWGREIERDLGGDNLYVKHAGTAPTSGTGRVMGAIEP